MKKKKTTLPTEVHIAWNGEGDDLFLNADVLAESLIEDGGPTEIGIYELKGIRRLSLKAVEEE